MQLYLLLCSMPINKPISGSITGVGRPDKPCFHSIRDAPFGQSGVNYPVAPSHLAQRADNRARVCLPRQPAPGVIGRDVIARWVMPPGVTRADGGITPDAGICNRLFRIIGGGDLGSRFALSRCI